MMMSRFTRRRMLGTLAAGAASLSVPPILQGRSEASERGDGDDRLLPAIVVDTHTHFFDPSRPEGVPWPGKGDAVLYRPTLPEHFLKVARPVGVSRTVVVEASPRLEDNQWLLDLASRSPAIVGVVGNLRPGEAGFADHLRRFAKDPLFRGIRISGAGLGKRLETPELPKDLKILADLDLALDVNGGPDILPGVAALAGQVPELRIVINHLANVKNDGQVNDAWLRGMEDCAKRARTWCKVSALAENAHPKDGDAKAPRDPAFYAPLLDAVWSIWGDDRVVFGSNWPVSQRAADYADVVAVVASHVAGRGKGSAEKFFAANAKAAYQWVER